MFDVGSRVKMNPVQLDGLNSNIPEGVVGTVIKVLPGSDGYKFPAKHSFYIRWDDGHVCTFFEWRLLPVGGPW